MENKIKKCNCGGEVTLSVVCKSGGMDGGYYDWQIFCKKCMGRWDYPADNFYGRDFYTKEEVIENWNANH